MPTISRNTAIRVWSLAAGRCTFESCPNDLFDITPDKLLGNLAHIVARKYTGPRGDPEFPNTKLNASDNLILLCAHHHQLVDNDVDNYSVESLRRMKADHEIRTSSALSLATPWSEQWLSLNYFNIPRLAMFSAICGETLDLPALPRFTFLHELGYQLGSLVSQFATAIQRIELSAIPIESISQLTEEHVGLYYSFLSSCWTRNIPSYTHLDENWALSGNCLRDPHLHFRHAETKVLLPIDPRWLTTSTSFHDLQGRGKTAKMSGIMQLKRIDQSGNLAVCSPLVFGLPLTAKADALFHGNLLGLLKEEAKRKVR